MGHATKGGDAVKAKERQDIQRHVERIIGETIEGVIRLHGLLPHEQKGEVRRRSSRRIRLYIQGREARLRKELTK